MGQVAVKGREGLRIVFYNGKKVSVHNFLFPTVPLCESEFYGKESWVFAYRHTVYHFSSTVYTKNSEGKNRINNFRVHPTKDKLLSKAEGGRIVFYNGKESKRT